MSAQPLARAFRQIGGVTAVSRVLGFVRDVVFAALLGPGCVAARLRRGAALLAEPRPE